MHTWRTAAVLAALCAGGAALSQEMAPGLWETRTRMQSDDPQVAQTLARLQAQLAKLPPDQRQLAEQMLGKQGMALSGDTLTHQVCVTAAMLAQGQLPVTAAGGCTTERTAAQGATTHWRMTCPQQSGSGTMTMAGPHAYQLVLDLNSTQPGQPRHVQLDVSGRWLGAACGH